MHKRHSKCTLQLIPENSVKIQRWKTELVGVHSHASCHEVSWFRLGPLTAEQTVFYNPVETLQHCGHACPTKNAMR